MTDALPRSSDTATETEPTRVLPALPPPPAAPPSRRQKLIHWGLRAGGVIALVAAVAGAAWVYRVQQHRKAETPPPAALPKTKAARVERVGDDALRVPPEVFASLGITTAAAKAADQPRALPPLQGTTSWDNNRLTRVYSPFPGIVVALGTTEKGETEQPFGDSGPHPLRNGDHVEANQLLAVVWSKDLGEKKSELIDAVSKLKLDQDTLNRYKSLTEGIIARKEVIAAEAAVRASENAVAKAVDTLRAWRLDPKEIDKLVEEAKQLSSGEARRELTSDKTWARVEIRAPFAGVIVEKNTNIRNVVDTATPLFQVADTSRLAVWVQIFEDDLPLFESLRKSSGKPVPWEIRIPSRPDCRRSGTLDQIGEIIDPTQHTALASGTVENPGQELKIGQFVTATISVKPAVGEVEVPTAALIEDGRTSVVFVQPDPHEAVFARRQVAVARRFHDVVYLTGDAVKPGDLVVAGGALQLNQALTDAPGRPASPAAPK